LVFAGNRPAGASRRRIGGAGIQDNIDKLLPIEVKARSTLRALIKTFTPVTSRIQTITRSLGRGRLQDVLCPLATMLGWRVTSPLLFVCAAVLVQPCAATPFQWEFTGSLNET
jgi:hypothetical protein